MAIGTAVQGAQTCPFVLGKHMGDGGGIEKTFKRHGAHGCRQNRLVTGQIKIDGIKVFIDGQHGGKIGHESRFVLKGIVIGFYDADEFPVIVHHVPAGSTHEIHGSIKLP